VAVAGGSDASYGGAVPTSYRERASVAALAGDVVCTWSQHVAPATDPYVHRVVPDACVDIIWRDEHLEVAGPDTSAVLAVLTPGASVVGLRFRPGHASAFLGVGASELVDARVDLAALWGAGATRLAERLAEAPDAHAATHALEEAVAARVARHAVDPLTDATTHLLDAPDGARVADVAPELGLSARQLQRRCVRAFGYGPKTLARVLRFQRFLRTARVAPSTTYARLAAECGYTDQAHLSRDCRALGGATPGELVPRAS
jgi:AraC-like DNA-binding protein